jgi:hypothetical protein
MSIPVRKGLPHEAPAWIDPAKEIHFITIYAEPRGKNHLARSDVADRLFETFIHRNQIGVWLVHFGLLTPDHLHLLVSLPQSGKRLKTIVIGGKSELQRASEFNGNATFSSMDCGVMRVIAKRQITFGLIQSGAVL